MAQVWQLAGIYLMKLRNCHLLFTRDCCQTACSLLLPVCHVNPILRHPAPGGKGTEVRGKAAYT